jgi:hypothetical protein
MCGIDFFNIEGPWAGIGSREAPMSVQLLMARYARTAYDLKLGRLHSGDAIASDFAFWVGARLSKNFFELGAKIFLSKNGYQGRWHDDQLGFINAKSLDPIKYEIAGKLAYEARKGFYGLGTGGKELVTRNAFQLLDEDLEHAVSKCLYWGIPQGKTEKVRGGTNVGLQLAILFDIPRMNLFHEENQRLLEEWLAQKETTEAYPKHLDRIIDSRRQDHPWPGF